MAAAQLVPRLRPFLSRTILSPTLASNELVNAHPAKEKLLHLGFGQSPFPVHPSLTKAMDAFQHNQYESTSGAADLRSSVASFYERKHNMDMSNYDVIVCPGSKLGLFALQAAIEGPTLLPVPSWVSYEPQMNLLGLQAIKFQALLSDEGMRLDPAMMQKVVDEHVAAGNPPPTKMIINSPNNPTGLIISNPDEVARFAEDNDIVVISDEIYDGVTPNGEWSTFAKHAPNNTVVTTGLSKVFSLGGWRVGVLLVPKSMTGLHNALCVIASETWSSVPSPVQRAAAMAYDADNADLNQYLVDCANIHHGIGLWFSDVLREGGIDCPRHQGSFYLYPNFDRYRVQLEKRGIKTSDDLARELVLKKDLVSLPATAFGDDDTLSLRLALCDYDGAAMLDRYVREGRRFSERMLLEEAPRIHAAAHALTDFVAA